MAQSITFPRLRVSFPLFLAHRRLAILAKCQASNWVGARVRSRSRVVGNNLTLRRIIRAVFFYPFARTRVQNISAG